MVVKFAGGLGGHLPLHGGYGGWVSVVVGGTVCEAGGEVWEPGGLEWDPGGWEYEPGG